MQNAKDTFFQMLQARIAALNPARTVLVRGLVRPGVVVAENELASGAVLTDVFRLEWSGMQVTAAGPMPLVTLECAIHYATDGTSGAGGMDRGRALAGMDAELLAALGGSGVNAAPQSTAKVQFAESVTGAQAVAMGTNVFWGDAVFGPCVTTNERLARTVTVPVLFYGEAGEL
jgi:hypothetical protein